MFQDITTLLLDTEAFKDTINLFADRYKGKDISVVAGNSNDWILSLSPCLFYVMELVDDFSP